MLERYSNQEIAAIWTDQKKFETFLKIELKTIEAWVKLGKIPQKDYVAILKTASFDLDRIYEIEKETKHDVIAFTRAVSETIPGTEKKWLHYGLTSTDVVDTANALLLKDANDIIENKIITFMKILKARAYEFKNTPTIGRTHGVHADITSFGLKWALWYDEMNRNLKRFREVREEVEIGKISGAVGNFVNTNPFVQDYVCEQLKINSSNISTQVLQRDRHANYIFVIALIASTISKIALEVRSLQRTEIFEVQEFFNKNQKGSSAMPHKKNPIASENITGIARIINGYVNPMLQDIQLWHERDISHSSVERIILPDATNLIVYMLNRYSKVLKNLIVYPENMMKNIYRTNGVIFSQRVLGYLIETSSLSREEIYDLIQGLVLKSFYDKLDFKTLLIEELVIKRNLLEEDKLEKLFSVDFFLTKVDVIFKRVFD